MRCPTAIWPILLAGCLGFSSGCCRPGYVLHGDWSFGLSRAPQPGCQSQPGCECQPGCQHRPGCQCQPGCGCQAKGNCPGQGSTAGQVGSPDGKASASQGAGRKGCPLGKRGAIAGVPGPTGPDQGHPRFHPVPTRPVFGSVSPPQVVPAVAPELSDPLMPEELPLPEPAPAPSSARRRPAVRHASVQVGSGYGCPGSQ